MKENREVYLIENAVFKNEAKNIKKIGKSLTAYSHTNTLNILATELGFNSYNEYENFLNRRGSLNSKPLSFLKIEELLKLKIRIKEKFESLNINLQNVYFIDNEISKKIKMMKMHDAYSFRLYFYTLPYILGCPELNCIDIENSKLDSNKAYCILKLLYEKYANDKSSLFKQFDYMKSYQLISNTFDIYNVLLNSENDYIDRIINSSFIKNKGLLNDPSYDYREFYFALDDIKNKDKKKEGLIFKWLMDVYNQEKTFDMLISDLQSEIDDEILFLNKFRLNLENDMNMKSVLNIPTFNSFDRSKNLLADVISNIKNNTNIEKPLLIGELYKDKRLFPFLNKIEFVGIEKQKLNNNVLITGASDSGKKQLLYSYVLQSMMNDKGFLFVSFGDATTFHFINGLAKSLNMKDKVINLSLKHLSEIKKIDINEIIKNNRILVITADNISDSNYVGDNALLLINELLSKIDKPFKGYYPFSFYLSCLYNFERLSYEKFSKNLKKINNKNYNCFWCVQDLESLKDSKEIILDDFKNILLMKLGNLNDVNEYKKYGFKFDLIDKESIDTKELLSQKAGSFYYLDLNNKSYKKVKGIYINNPSYLWADEYHEINTIKLIF